LYPNKKCNIYLNTIIGDMSKLGENGGYLGDGLVELFVFLLGDIGGRPQPDGLSVVQQFPVPLGLLASLGLLVVLALLLLLCMGSPNVSGLCKEAAPSKHWIHKWST
jgi:hypothetical protein